jgi:hypothetical protein
VILLGGETAFRRVVEGVVRQFAAVPREPGPVLVVAKSLGTLAAHHAVERGYPAIWLTPVLRAAVLYPLAAESGALAGRASTVRTTPAGARRSHPVDRREQQDHRKPAWENANRLLP